MKRSPRTTIVGFRFSRLVVLREAETGPNSQRRVDVRCDCGTERTVYEGSLKQGKTTSCGCLQRERVKASATTHGMTHSPTHRSWGKMLGRCRNPNDDRFADYGGRGITVCERWLSFENFLADMGERPSPDHSIDRIRVDGNYEPGNVRWATRKEQMRNRRISTAVTFQGETKTVAEWAELYGLAQNVLHGRITNGWSIEKALKTPVMRRSS